jgi:RNase P protein component
LDGEPCYPFYLQAKDVVFVPRTRIAELNQWIAQHINQMIPQAGIVYTAPAGNGTVTIDSRADRR